MNLLPTPITGLWIAETKRLGDTRGSFARLFCHNELKAAIGDRSIVQINQSRTTAKGAVRGMHFQHSPNAEMKLVRCTKGRVWDVVVDLRTDSPTLLQWHAEELTPDNARMLVIPEGCAHGFQVLESESEMLYLHTADYAPSSEGAVAFDDPAIKIPWPLAITDMSERDKQHPHLSPDFRGIALP